MEPILNERSLCPARDPRARVVALVGLLRELDGLGLAPVLRMVRGASERDLGESRGLRAWLGSMRRPDEIDKARWLGRRLAMAPFIDGSDGLMAQQEGDDAIEATVRGEPALGLGYAALTDQIAVGLYGGPDGDGPRVNVELLRIDSDGTEQVETNAVPFCTRTEVLTELQPWLDARTFAQLSSGSQLLAQLPAAFPHLRVGSGAERQLRELARGRTPGFDAILRWFAALNRGAAEWGEGSFSPVDGLRWSVESAATLTHAKYGPLRDFPCPEGFAARRFSLHAKLPSAKRLYFDAEKVDGRGVVLIGYVGHHLDTVRFS